MMKREDVEKVFVAYSKWRRKLRKTAVTIAGVRAKIRTPDFPNTEQSANHFTAIFGSTVWKPENSQISY
jgi:hypothetical protein